MVKYTMSLYVEGSKSSCDYILDLKQSQENNPDEIFVRNKREEIRKFFQNETFCYISEKNLNLIISVWIEDIREGTRSSSLELSLPPLNEAGIHDLKELGNQVIPQLIQPTLAMFEPQLGELPGLDFF